MRSWLNWIEQRTSNPQVEGSSPPGRACRGFDGVRRTPFFFVLTPISQSVKNFSTSINAIKDALTTSKCYSINGRFNGRFLHIAKTTVFCAANSLRFYLYDVSRRLFEVRVQDVQVMIFRRLWAVADPFRLRKLAELLLNVDRA